MIFTLRIKCLYSSKLCHLPACPDPDIPIFRKQDTYVFFISNNTHRREEVQVPHLLQGDDPGGASQGPSRDARQGKRAYISQSCILRAFE